jgi:ATP-binding protein involved in chromosome partitioning
LEKNSVIPDNLILFGFPMIDIGKIEAAAAQVSQGRVSAVREKEGSVSMMLDVAGLSEAARAELSKEIEKAVASVAPDVRLRLLQTAERIVPRLIAIASGKGGVGKSTLSANLAVAMRRQGRGVGLVDADIYGPSQPRLLGVEDVKPEAEGKKMYPVTGAGNVPFLSMGQLAGPGQAIAWRGPMAGQALTQLVDAHWGDVREIIVDMPPGTGDIQLSMIQKHKPVGALIISTPQDLALMDAERAIGFFRQAQVPIIGLVENMAGYICPHCGEVSDPFGRGGAEAAAAEMDIAFLGRIPLDISVRVASDAGMPPALGDDPVGKAFADIAGQLAAWLDHPQGPVA